MGFDAVVDLQTEEISRFVPNQQSANVLNKPGSGDATARIAALEKRVKQLELALRISASGDVCLHGGSVTITAQQNIHLKPAKRVLAEHLATRALEFVRYRKVKLFK